MQNFTPILYLKASCPFCLKVAAFLSEAGAFARLEVRDFWPGDDREQEIRDELAPHFETVSFPSLQHTPGAFMKDSDVIIDYFADRLAIDPASMRFYRYVTQGPMRRMREQFAQIRTLERERIGAP